MMFIASLHFEFSTKQMAILFNKCTLKFCTFKFVPELTKNISPFGLYIAIFSFNALSKNHSLYEQTHLETQHLW